MAAYYNEIDPTAAAWLRNLIAGGHIAPGDVDERSILDVRPDDLRGFRQHHFFAGIGGWSHALRLAGWPDDRPVWTGSCPCQPFSSAGKRRGAADERHLWPEFYRLIGECRPAVVFGEQVASKDGRLWLSGVRADLEALGYAVGAADLCAAGVGAPHIRQRLWWVADAGCPSLRGGGPGAFTGTPGGVQGAHRQRQRLRADAGAGSAAMALGLADADGRLDLPDSAGREPGQPAAAPVGHGCAAEPAGGVGRVGDASSAGLEERERDGGVRRAEMETQPGGAAECAGHPGFWSDFDLIPCGDGKARRIEPGTFPLAHGVPGRVGRLRGYGNAINPHVAAEFIRAYDGCR